MKTRAIALYESGLSARAVTGRLGKERGAYVSPQTVARWMRELGRSRPVGEPRSIELGPEAKRLYESGLNVEQVADRFGVGKTATRHRLHEMGVKLRPSGSRFVQFLTRVRLQAMYVDERRTMADIAEEIGCSIGTVYRLLRLHGIRRLKQ